MIGLLPGHVKHALKPGLELQKCLVLVAHADYPVLERFGARAKK
jgi:hypothetical protein